MRVETVVNHAGVGVLDAPCGATYFVPLRPGDRQKSTFYRRGVEDADPYGIVRVGGRHDSRPP